MIRSSPCASSVVLGEEFHQETDSSSRCASRLDNFETGSRGSGMNVKRLTLTNSPYHAPPTWNARTLLKQHKKETIRKTGSQERCDRRNAWLNTKSLWRAVARAPCLASTMATALRRAAHMTPHLCRASTRAKCLILRLAPRDREVHRLRLSTEVHHPEREASSTVRCKRNSALARNKVKRCWLRTLPSHTCSVPS